jgi:hypothetical protein
MAARLAGAAAVAACLPRDSRGFYAAEQRHIACSQQCVPTRRPSVKYLTLIGAWLLVAAVSGCSAEVDEAAPEPDGAVATSSQELKNWGGSTPGSCLDRCLNLCPKDGNGGIEAGCLLTCLGACSSRTGVGSVGSAVFAK